MIYSMLLQRTKGIARVERSYRIVLGSILLFAFNLSSDEKLCRPFFDFARCSVTAMNLLEKML